jgi:hypothetical protein
MVDREPSDDLVAAALRRVVGEPDGDLGEVLARGTRVRRARTRRSVVLLVAAVLAVAVALSFAVLRAPSTAPEPAHVPDHSQPSGISTGTYSTAPLSATTLIRNGMKPTEVWAQQTVLTLRFERLTHDQTERNQNGSYTQFDAEDGGPPKKGDTGAFAVHGRTITFVSSYHFQRATYIVHPTSDGFRLEVKHFYFKDPDERRIATAIWTTAAFHRN